jgi:DNA-binding response OmpR family regulator
MEVFAAAEGSIIEFPPQPAKAPKPAGDNALATFDADSVIANPVLIACADPELATKLRTAAEAEGLVVIAAKEAAEALELAHSYRPTLMLIERAMVTDDGLAFYRALRAGPDMTKLPVIMLAEDDAPPGFVQAAGITDWLVMPASQEYLRTKLRAWMLRAHARWQRAPLPSDEQKRLRALRGLALLDTPPEERFDRITRLAASHFDVPLAMVTLVDADRQWFKSRHGDIAAQTPRDPAFCAHAILGSRALVIPDALGDDRFADNPLVTAKSRVRFYAGQPVTAPDGSIVGTLCVMDHRPRDFDAADLRVLVDLASMVERELHATQTP